ncbi:MAG TPA: hypothetical protein VL120_17905 [Solirubrobacteraceae bacterium]|nr:hypothetical protein [Solirubrobacteraceae bacterium]
MSQTGTSAWWADVQHLRDAAECTDEARRRADQADLAARRESRERRQVDAEVAPVRRFEPDPSPPSRRRAHADGPAPRRPEAPSLPRRGGYGEAVGLPGRRTIEIRGRTVPAPAVPRSLELDRTRRPPRRAIERVGPRPDKLAMWALMMGLVLILVALSTSSPT